MVVLRLIGDEWSWDDRIALAVPPQRAFSMCTTHLVSKLGAEKWSGLVLYRTEGRPPKFCRPTTPVALSSCPQREGLRDGSVLWVRVGPSLAQQERDCAFQRALEEWRAANGLKGIEADGADVQRFAEELRTRLSAAPAREIAADEAEGREAIGGAEHRCFAHMTAAHRERVRLRGEEEEARGRIAAEEERKREAIEGEKEIKREAARIAEAAAAEEKERKRKQEAAAAAAATAAEKEEIERKQEAARIAAEAAAAEEEENKRKREAARIAAEAAAAEEEEENQRKQGAAAAAAARQAMENSKPSGALFDAASVRAELRDLLRPIEESHRAELAALRHMCTDTAHQIAELTAHVRGLVGPLTDTATYTAKAPILYEPMEKSLQKSVEDPTRCAQWCGADARAVLVAFALRHALPPCAARSAAAASALVDDLLRRCRSAHAAADALCVACRVAAHPLRRRFLLAAERHAPQLCAVVDVMLELCAGREAELMLWVRPELAAAGRFESYGEYYYHTAADISQWERPAAGLTVGDWTRLIDKQ